MQIIQIEYIDKGKYNVVFDAADTLILYKSEIKSVILEVGSEIDEDKYNDIVINVVGKRATKRAMHILEKNDKTENQLRDKLKECGYPDSAVNIALEYVKSFGYIDDARYCYNYISYRIEKQNKFKICQSLLAKGINKDIIEETYEELDDSSFTDKQIKELLLKKNYDLYKDDREKSNKIIQSIMRKGYKYSDIRRLTQFDAGDLDID